MNLPAMMLLDPSAFSPGNKDDDVALRRFVLHVVIDVIVVVVDVVVAVVVVDVVVAVAAVVVVVAVVAVAAVVAVVAVVVELRRGPVPR